MVPTHELAVQVSDVFQSFSKNTSLRIMALYGGVKQEDQIERLASGVDVLVTTPGRMFDLRAQGFLKLDFVEILVLDEADHMLDMGFLHDIYDVLKYIPEKRQTLFFSATIDDSIKKIAYTIVRKPIRIQISPKDPVSKNVDHCVMYVEMDEKRFFLERIIKEHPKSKILTFVRTKVRSERVQKALLRVGIESIVMHGGLEQGERSKVLEQFKSGSTLVMVATDVSGRGIDIPNVEYVINYDLPEKMEYYVHRVGRTGRGDSRGQAISFCSKEEKPILEEIESWIGSKIAVLELDKEDREGVVLATEENKYDLKKLLKEIEETENRQRKKGKKKR